MNTARMPDLGKEYLAWLQGNLITAKHENGQILSTPFLDPFHDGIQIYFEKNNGEIVLHDAGHTLENLLDQGVKIEGSDRRQSLVDRAIAGCGVQWMNGRLQAFASEANLAQRAHFLLTAMLRVNDLWMSAAPRSMKDFAALVQEFLDEHDVRYLANVAIPGRTVEHPMDFVIPLAKGKERLIKLVSTPSVQTAKLISFTWVDLRETRPQAERITLLNDTFIAGALDEAPSAELRTVSEQAEAILRGYSQQVCRWSAHNDPSFESIWKVA